MVYLIFDFFTKANSVLFVVRDVQCHLFQTIQIIELYAKQWIVNLNCIHEGIKGDKMTKWSDRQHFEFTLSLLVFFSGRIRES